MQHINKRKIKKNQMSGQKQVIFIDILKSDDNQYTKNMCRHKIIYQDHDSSICPGCPYQNAIFIFEEHQKQNKKNKYVDI